MEAVTLPSMTFIVYDDYYLITILVHTVVHTAVHRDRPRKRGARNDPVSKPHNSARVWTMSGLTRDETAEPVSRD